MIVSEKGAASSDGAASQTFIVQKDGKKGNRKGRLLFTDKCTMAVKRPLLMLNKRRAVV